MITEKNCSLRKTASHQTDIMLLFKEQIRKNTPTNVNGDIVFDVVNPFPSKGFPIDE